MITIVCEDIEDLLVEMAAYLSDNIAAVAVIKTGRIVLDLLERNGTSVKDVRIHVENFLVERGLSRDFIIKVHGEKIMIIATSERKIVIKKEESGLLVCPYCGMVTPYEEEMNVHIKADLAGGIC